MQGLANRYYGVLEKFRGDAVWSRSTTILHFADGCADLLEGRGVDGRVRVRHCVRCEVLEVGARRSSRMVQCGLIELFASL
jgi:hypothetical protein